jgi:N-methylhydantoinase A/oxoprolinase/acetone carboxylase beta subunit
MRIAACETIQQWGFDETTIDGHEVINQWAMLVDVSLGDEIGEGGTSIVTLECAGVLPCSLASDHGPIFLKLKEEAASFTKRST